MGNKIVSDALDAKPRGLTEPGLRFRSYILNTMPDADTRALAEEFFDVGARVVESKNAVAIQIAAMQECLGSWSVRAATVP